VWRFLEIAKTGLEQAIETNEATVIATDESAT
jgi:hypothetical protein